MARKSTIKKAAKSEVYDVTLKGLTLGELLSLRNGLARYAEVSPVAADVLGYLNSGLEESVEPRIQELLAEDKQFAEQERRITALETKIEERQLTRGISAMADGELRVLREHALADVQKHPQIKGYPGYAAYTAALVEDVLRLRALLSVSPSPTSVSSTLPAEVVERAVSFAVAQRNAGEAFCHSWGVQQLLDAALDGYALVKRIVFAERLEESDGT